MKRFLSILAAAVICSAMTSNAYAAVEFLEPEPVKEPIAVVEEVKKDPFKPSETNPLVIYQPDNMTDILIKWVPDNFTEEIIIYVYDEKKEKYCKLLTKDYDSGTAYIEGPQPETEYKFLVRKFDSDGDIIFNEKASLTTRIAAPTLTIRTDKKAKISWNSNSNLATGYELYAMEQPLNDYRSYVNYSDWSYKELDKQGFRLVKESDETASGSVTFKTNKAYNVIVRTFYYENGEKVYSFFSHGTNTLCAESYLNALTLNSKEVCSGDEIKLVKKYVDSVITDDMTNYEKLVAIFNLVHSHGNYQNDINKIDGNRPVWQIMEKQEGQCASWAFCLDAMLEYAGFDVKVVRGLRDSGQQHFWCQIELHGDMYNLDAHLGSCLTGSYSESYIGYKIVEIF